MTEKILTKQLKQVSTDSNLGNSDSLLPTQKAVKTYVDTADSELQSQIEELKSRGRFLSLWNSATGLAESDPPVSPYEYSTGDYFIVGTVSNTVNYKPDGTSYVIGMASTTVETEEVAVDDTYFFDGSVWKLQSNSNKTVTYASLAGDIYDSTSAATALNAKQDVISDLATIRNGAAIYVHDQAEAASTWTINHNLGKHPSITVVDTGGNVVVGNYTYTDANTVVAEFNAAFKGTAYLN